MLPWKDLTPTDPDTLTNAYPNSLRNHTAVVVEDKMYLIGGVRKSIQSSGLVWEYSFPNNTWVVASKACSTLGEFQFEGHSTVLWQDTEIVNYGGFYSGVYAGYGSRIVSYNLKSKEWNILFDHGDEGEGAYPCKRAASGVALLKDFLYVFGGTNVQIRYGDFWRFNLKSPQWE